LRLRFDDFSRATRSHTSGRATDETAAVLASVRTLLTAAAPLIEVAGLTLIGVALSNFDDRDTIQLELPFEAAIAVDAAADRVRDRFGAAALTRAVLLGRDPGYEVPLLPD
jgi:DNA polymerase IV